MFSLKFLLSKLIQKIAIPEVRDSYLHKNAKLSPGSVFKFSKIGKYSYIGKNTSVIHTEIGNFTSIASNCAIGLASHPMQYGSLSPMFCAGRNIFGSNFAEHKFEPYKKTVIGHDVWIGEKAIIVGGVKIGNGAIVGAGAVVTKDIPPYEVWGGTPAKFLKKRFSTEIISALQNGEFWEWDDAKIKQLAPYIHNVKELIDKITDLKKEK